MGKYGKLRSFAQRQRSHEELEWMSSKWGEQLLRDPFYSANLSLVLPGFELAFPPRLVSLAQGGIGSEECPSWEANKIS